MVQWTVEVHSSPPITQAALDEKLREAGFEQVQGARNEWLRHPTAEGVVTWPRVGSDAQAHFFYAMTSNYGYWPDWWMGWVKTQFAGCHYRELNKDGDLVNAGPILPN